MDIKVVASKTALVEAEATAVQAAVAAVVD